MQTRTDDLLNTYRLRVVRIGVQATILMLAALIVFPFLPDHGDIRLAVFVSGLAAAAAGVAVVHFLPWERLMEQGLGMWAFYAWSVLDILIISVMLAASGGASSALFLIYALTTVFFALAYPPRGQQLLFVLTVACYIVASVVGPGPFEAGVVFLRLATLGVLAVMASFMARELMDNLQAHGEERRRSERRASLLRTVATAAREMTDLAPGQVLERVIKCSLELGWDASEICAVREDGSYSVISARGLPAHYVAHDHDGSVGIIPHVWRTGRSVVIDDYSHWSDALPDMKDAGYGAVIATPVRVEGKIEAVLAAGVTTAWSIEAPEVEAFELLAGQAGRALESARRFVEMADRARLEEQLRESQKLEALGRLAGGIAHDFNNLLAVILNYARFVRSELDPGSEAAADAGEIILAGDRGAELVRQLLTFSRRDQIGSGVADVNRTVDAMQRLLQGALGEHIALEIDLAPDLPSIGIDEGQLEQVLMNLAVNARDAMPDGGSLRVASSLGAPGTPDDGRVVIEVADSGTGMTPQVQARAFEPFFSTKPRGQGTGLGLATVYGIVRQAGGEIALESVKGSHCRFFMSFPPAADLDKTRDGEGPAPAEARGSGQRVLLAEDEDAVRASIERILGRSGYVVTAVASGPEAVSAYEKEPDFDLLLTDMVMPGMSGAELAEKLQRRGNGMKVIFMSGYADDFIERHETTGSRGRPLLRKPFHPDELLASVEQELAPS